MSLKIAIIIERADITLGGAERSVFELRAALSALGLDVDILAAKGRSNAKHINILCPDSPGKRVNFFAFEKALKQYLSENKYDIIHSVLPFDFADIYQPRGGTYAETILRNSASYQNRYVEFYKNLFSFTNSRRTTLLRAERKLSESSKGPLIATLSQYVANQFRQHYNTDAKRIVIIPNGVKINPQINKGHAERFRSQTLAKLGLKEANNPVLFLFAANNFRLKGLSPLIKAMQIVSDRKTQRQAHLVVIGSGKTKKYNRLVQKVNNSSMFKRIVFMGSVSHIQNAISMIDVAVLPTFYDPSSRFILEALSAGKPVITTKYNGAADLFTKDRHGKVIDEPSDIAALANAIEYFTDTDNINKASEAIIKDNLCENISISRVAEQLRNVYESIMQKKGEK